MYGAVGKTLAVKLGCTSEEADEYIAKAYAAYPIRELQEAVWGACRQRKGSLFTCMGRRLYYPHINSKDFSKRSRAERQTFNALLQGGSADILKALTLDVLPEAHRMGAYLAASIHDELLFYCPEQRSQELAAYLGDAFTKPLLSHCPIKGTPKIGKNWLEVH